MIKYIGKKHLNSNFYKKIVLTEESEFVKVRTLVDERFKKTLSLKLNSETITQQVEGLSDYDKLKELVLYFLRNNTICEIAREKDKIVVTSTSYRELVLQLSNEYNELLNLIIKKYENDRLQFVENCVAEKVYIQTVHFDKRLKIISGTTCYYAGIDSDGKSRALVLILASSNHNITEFDKNFIMTYIKNMIYSSEENIIYYREENGLHLRCCGKSIRIPQELTKEVWILVMNRNYEISKMNEKQYKLEGIK